LAAAFSQCKRQGVVLNPVLSQELEQAMVLMHRILQHDDEETITNQLIGDNDGQ
jgi:hypothetical protein